MRNVTKKPDTPVEPEPDGDYIEAVQLLVDGVIEDIRSGALRKRVLARKQLAEHLSDSIWTRDVDLSIRVLKASAHPTTLFACFRGNPDPIAALIALSVGTQGKTDFPFAAFALSAMGEDCVQRLRASPIYQALPPQSNAPKGW